MTLHQKYLGVDICKDFLDVYDNQMARAKRWPNTPRDVRKLLKTFPDHFFVFEATSVCDQTLRDTLSQCKIPFSRVNPRRAREFARASGYLAKTDQVDAKMLADMGARLDLPQTHEPSAQHQKLAALVQRREQLTGDIVAQKNRAKQLQFADMKRSIERQLRWLEKERASIERKINAHIKANDTLSATAKTIQTVPGIGPVIAATLVAFMPELGTRDRRAIAALAGLAPLANDSGRRFGKRKIWGGRRRVRRALFIAAMHASRRCPHMAAMRERMVKAAKPTKTILIAIARKLLVTINAMIRTQSDYEKQPISTAITTP